MAQGFGFVWRHAGRQDAEEVPVGASDGGKSKIDKIEAAYCRSMAIVTNAPDNPKTVEPAVDADLDAAIRELDRLRRSAASTVRPEPAAREANSAFRVAGPSANGAAGLRSEAGSFSTSGSTQADSGAVGADPSGGSDVGIDDDLFAAEPLSTPAPPEVAVMRSGTPVTLDPPQAADTGNLPSPSHAAAQAQWVEVDLGAEVELRTEVDVGAQVDLGAEESAPSVGALPTAVPAESGGDEPQGETPEPEVLSQELVDLDPVREAMQSVALARVQALPVERPSAAAIAGVSGKAASAEPADAAPVGVLLVNLGTPDAPTARAVRRYLREFLSDRRVIEKDTFAWQVRLRTVILPFRPRSRARAYRGIWNREANESPLKTVTRSQAEQLGEALALGGSDVTVAWAMRYGNPSIESGIKTLIAKGCERIVLMPLYPQYASTTTATVCDEAFRVLMRLRNQPPLRVAPPYYSNPVYIDAIASSIRDNVAKLSFEPEVILASYRGVPQEYVQNGDPYGQQCMRTTELLRERLGMDETRFVMAFQSRVGVSAGLRPYTDEALSTLAKGGIRNVAVVAPGFAVDCLETLEEIAVANGRVFKKRGGENFAFIPSLNDSERGMRVIREIAVRELNGWM